MKSVILTALLCAGFAGAGVKDKVVAGDPLSTSRTVTYHQSEVIRISAQINFSTMIIFDHREKVVVGTTGDADHWWLETAANVVTIKPKDASARSGKTNINVVMASGNVYSFFVEEISDQPDGHADLKVFVNPGEDSLLKDINSQMFVSTSEVDKYKKEVEDAKAALEKQKASAQEKIKDAQNSAPALIRHDYTIKGTGRVKKQFGVKAMYTLNGFTYIEAEPKEAPAVYEVKDGKPSLVEVDFVKGRYVIQKVVEEGYMLVGKSKLEFKREDRG